MKIFQIKSLILIAKFRLQFSMPKDSLTFQLTNKEEGGDSSNRGVKPAAFHDKI